MKSILIVDDNREIHEVFTDVLSSHFQLTSAYSLSEARQKLEKQPFDLALLDLCLPDGNGFQLCTMLRSESRFANVPVIFISGQAETLDKVMAFSLGADDFIVKPFEPMELKARIQARLRLQTSLAAPTPDTGNRKEFVKGDLRFDLVLQKAFVLENGKETDLNLTPSEFRILLFLATHDKSAHSKEDILKALWPKDVHVELDNIYTYVSSLRKKLKSRSGYLQCIPRMGYRFSLPNAH